MTPAAHSALACADALLSHGYPDYAEAVLQPHASAAPAIAMIKRGAITQAIQWIREQREEGSDGD